MVGIDEYLGHPGEAKRTKPDVQQRCPPNRQQALGDSVSEGTQPAAKTSGEQERLHVRDFRTTPSARILASAPARIESSPAISSSQSAYSATESAGSASVAIRAA